MGAILSAITGAPKSVMYTISLFLLLTQIPVTDADIEQVTHEINDNKNMPDTTPVRAMPRLDINTDSPLDINWRGMLTLNGVGATPAAEQITLPSIHGHTYKMDNLSIKLRVVDVWF